MVTTFKNPIDAKKSLTDAFNPTNQAQTDAIATASALVPNIPINDIKPTTPIDISTPVDDTTSNIEGDVAFFKGLNEQAKTDKEKKLALDKEGGESNLTKLLNDVTGLGKEQLNLEEEIVNPIDTEIADITGQADVLIAEYNKLLKIREDRKAKLALEAGAKGVTRQGVLQGQQLAIDTEAGTELNLKASEIGILQAKALALQGKADLAQKQIDRAIDLKYKDTEARISAQEFQLQQIQDYLDAEEKKRADALQYALDKEKDRVDEQKEQDKLIQNMLLQAGIAQAPQSVIDRANQIIADGGTASEVATVLGKYSSEYLDYKIKQATLTKTNQDIEQTRLENAQTAAAIKAIENGTGLSFANLSEKQQDTTLKLRDKYNAESKDFVKVRDAYNRVKVSAEDPSAAGDLALIFNYMKILDPGSVVRESEFANTAASGSYGERLKAAGDKIIAGKRLSPEMRADFVNRSDRLFIAQQSQQQVINNNYNFLSESANIPKEFVTRDISSAINSEEEILNDNWNATVGDTTSSTVILDNMIKNINNTTNKI